MKNKFIIITPAHNVQDWIGLNIEIIKHQSYKNFLHLIINDGSTDATKSTVQMLHHPHLIFTDTPEGRGGSQGDTYLYGIEFLEKHKLINEEDIIVEVDSDDWLSSTFVLEYLNQIYQDPNIWMTHGQYQIYPTSQTGGHYQQRILNEEYRFLPFPYSHLKTYKYWLLNKIDRKDLTNSETEKIFNAAWDHALCLPMVEMAGKEHIFMCEDILYILNRSEELKNEGKTRSGEQKYIEQLIRQKPKYDKIKICK